jgi:carbon monoxide dehydrogenase subunit G
MFQVEDIKEIDTTKEKMWSIWTDIENWNHWINSVESSALEGNFENGVKGSMKIKGRSSSFRIVEVVENESFICRSKLPLCTMDAGHVMKEENGKLQVKLYAKAYGPLTFIFKSAIEKEAKGLKTALEKLEELARK